MKHYLWPSHTTVPGTKTVPGSKTYDADAGAHLFWEDWYGPALLWIDPKTDWGPTDYYNADDLNRVEINTIYIKQKLESIRDEVINLVTVTNRDKKRIEFADSLNRIEGNIKLLADKFYKPLGWEPPKLNWASKQPFSYQDANRLEKNLLLLYEAIQSALESFRYCGTFYAGEEAGMIGV